MIIITSAFNTDEPTPYTFPPTLNHISSSTKKLFGIYWFHYSAMVNGSDLGEVANWKGGMGAHCQSDLLWSWASEKKLVKYARDMKYSSYLC